jgi:hypothetical protein
MEDKIQEESIPAPANTPAPTVKQKDKRPEVIVVRNWKEYIGESLLIIFSVALAISLTEIFNNVHEKQLSHQILHNLREELIGNLASEERQYKYYQLVFKNIDSALKNDAYRKQFFIGEEINLFSIAPHGIVLRKDLNDAAWQTAKQTEIYSKMSLETYGLITDIYNEHQRLNKTEDEVGKVLLSFESRKPQNQRTTLILVRDNIDVWAVLRAPGLLKMYKKAIAELSNY